MTARAAGTDYAAEMMMAVAQKMIHNADIQSLMYAVLRWVRESFAIFYHSTIYFQMVEIINENWKDFNLVYQ